VPAKHTLRYAVKYFDWDDAKNAKLRTERGIGFEDIVFHIERGDLLDILEHPNPDGYAGQRNLGRLTRGLRVLGAVRRGRAHGLPEDDHPESEGDEAAPG
jgi:uncharacterized DUF497 family protein